MYIGRLLGYSLGFVAANAHPSAQGHGRLFSSAFGVPGLSASYDYVVIGGGTAGITIASRLAEDPAVSVAIIEAGGFYEVDNGNYSVVPGLSLSSPFLATTANVPKQPLIDWGLVSVPQIGASNRQIHYAQGKTLSGSSALNAMAYHRGTNGTYQRWAELVNDRTYTFPNLLPYFQKSCKLTPPNDAKQRTPNATVKYDVAAFSTLGGPLQVSWCNWVDPALTWFQKAFEAIGLPISDLNFNSGTLSGFSAWITSTISPLDAKRSSSQASFLKQAIANTNIMVYTQAQARQILFNSTGCDADNSFTASGVLVTTQNVNYTISAKKEIILSAGVYHSPQLLMVSGIGPCATLEQYNIPVIANLPGVGQNLWDQVIFGVINEINLPTAMQLMTEQKYEQQSVQQYLQEAAGPFSSQNGYIAFEKIPVELRSNFTPAALSALDWFPSDWPEVEYIASTAVSATGGGLGLVLAALSAPLSRGNVTIGSADASVPPVINLGWLTDPANADAQVAIAGFKRCHQAWSQISNIVIGNEVAPGPTVQTDDEILTYIRNTINPLYHPAATCAMGAEGDANAVVDSSARVFGVRGLRVVDNSAAPFAVPGHPQATVYMLAEKIADLIRNGG